MNERLYGLSLRLMAQNYALFTYRPNPFCFFCEEGGGGGSGFCLLLLTQGTKRELHSHMFLWRY